MNTETEPEQTQSGFQVRLSNFEGPFDLLLQLIERECRLLADRGLAAAGAVACRSNRG